MHRRCLLRTTSIHRRTDRIVSQPSSATTGSLRNRQSRLCLKKKPSFLFFIFSQSRARKKEVYRSETMAAAAPVLPAKIKTIVFHTPKEASETMMAGGIAKAKISWEKTLFLGFLAGAYVAFGGTLAITIAGGYPVTATNGNNYGTQKVRPQLARSAFACGVVGRVCSPYYILSRRRGPVILYSSSSARSFRRDSSWLLLLALNSSLEILRLWSLVSWPARLLDGNG